MRRAAHLAFVLYLLSCSACSCLKTHKVPLAERLSGQDGKYNGFRYYTSRPYVAVSQRVDVAHNYVLGKLVGIAYLDEQGKEKPGIPRQAGILSLATDPLTGHRDLYNLEGEKLEFHKKSSGGWVLVQVEPPAELHRAGFEEAADLTPEEKATLKKIQENTDKLLSRPTLSAGEGKALEKILANSESILKAGPGRTTVTPQTVISVMDNGGSVPPPPDPDNFQVVFLPDFEEQMAIKDCNFLAYGKYNLTFADGWQLAGVSGTWDSTEVPVRVLQSLSNAISAAAAVKTKALGTLPITADEIRKVGANTKDQGAGFKLALITMIEYIPPGMYRLNKASELTEACKGRGLLSEMGLPTAHDRKVQLVKQAEN